MAIERFEDIEAWKVGRELTLQIYKATNNGPFVRDHGLRSQIQRAVKAKSSIHGFMRYLRNVAPST